jgi:hypothetical protein
MEIRGIMDRVIRFLWRLSSVGLLITASACASASANSNAVPLAVPAPPPRDVPLPVALPEIAEAEPPPPPPAAAPETPPQPRRPATPAPPASAAAPVAVPPAQVATPPPPADLRATGAGKQAISADEVRRIIDRADRVLDGVDPRRLNSAGRVQHDTARRFVTQAEAAVKADNLMFAKYLAEKGETLANGLR